MFKGRMPAQAPLPCQKSEEELMYNKCDVCDMVFTQKIAWQGKADMIMEICYAPII